MTTINFDQIGASIYSSREERAAFIAQKLTPWVGRSVLDVGCGDALLKPLLEADIKYIGIDFVGAMDIVVNLEEASLPFKSNSFDTVICTDVLEHIDNIHPLFDELVRITNRYILISLPNPYGGIVRDAVYTMISSRSRLSDTKIGLPIEQPKDRHKWFFRYSDAEKFYRGRAAKHGIHVVAVFPIFGRKRKWIEPFRRLLFRGNYSEFMAETAWTILEKSSATYL